MIKKAENSEKKAKIYEIGYLIVPTLPEDKLGEAVGKIKGDIEGISGVVISEEFPKIRPLAYQINQALTGKIRKFNTAYFGWVKFETSTGDIKSLESALKNNEDVLRFLLINTVRENTLFTKSAYPKSEFEKTSKPVTPAEKTESATTSPVTIEELDKTIEGLIVE